MIIKYSQQNILVVQGKTQQYLANKLADSLLVVKTLQPTSHEFSFMGQVKSEQTQRKIRIYLITESGLFKADTVVSV